MSVTSASYDDYYGTSKKKMIKNNNVMSRDIVTICMSQVTSSHQKYFQSLCQATHVLEDAKS